MTLRRLGGATLSDVIKLLPEHDTGEPAAPRQVSVEVPLWWFVAVILLQLAGMIYAQYDRSGMRRELDENAVLIRQLQEQRAVNELVKLKRGE